MINTSKSRKTIILLVILLLAGGGIYLATMGDEARPSNDDTKPASQSTQSKAGPSFDKQKFSLTDATSPWVIVNKQHPLQPQTYVPSDLRLPMVSLRIPGAEQMKLRDEAATAIEKMFADAKSSGLNLQITTAFRGYNYQKTLYDGYVAEQGQEAADKESARPGYSEHQTGLAADVRPESGKCYLEACFGETPEGQWVAANAYKYGYIIRYINGKTDSTGYSYEPWHIRYVGKELASELHKQNNPTLEEFFIVSGGSVYN